MTTVATAPALLALVLIAVRVVWSGLLRHRGAEQVNRLIRAGRIDTTLAETTGDEVAWRPDHE